jgi:hypothetical protein
VTAKTKLCRYCQTQIPEAASVCPQCRKRLSTHPVTGCIALGLVGVIGLFMLAMCPSTKPTRSPAQAAQDRAVDETRVICQEAIKATLKAPATAKFPHISTSEVGRAAENKDIVRILTYVDAQNSFGAVIRTHFQCDCRQQGNRWVLADLKPIDQ